MSNNIVHLRLDRVPFFVGTSLYGCIDSDTERALKPLVDAYSRLRCASRFLQRFGGSIEHLNIGEDERLIVWGGYLRAALMEYAGMEDFVRSDLRRIGAMAQGVSIYSTQNAMLILLRELRNLHVHVVLNSFDIRRKNAVIRSLNEHPDANLLRFFGKEEQHEVDVLTIPRSDLDQLLTSRSSHRFDRAELETAIAWLDDAQNRWGIQDVLLAALEQYSELIVGAIPPNTL